MSSSVQHDCWLKANRNLIAKAIGELTYEQVLSPVAGGAGCFSLQLSSGVAYRFEAWRTVWGWLRVRPESLLRGDRAPESAGQFFVDAQAELGMNELTLGTFLEEMHSTLFADVRLLQKNRDLNASEMARWDGDRIQSVLNGHPKILLNKGRMGWGAGDAEQFAPESERDFQLHWVAIDRQLSQQTGSPEVPLELRDTLGERGLDPERFCFVPLHPWQWDRVVRIQYEAWIASGQMISLGQRGDFYRPQISLRTLSNRARPAACDIKLPLSILNTSAVRGLSARSILAGPAVAQAFARICEGDSFLSARGVGVLADQAGVACSHPIFSQVPGAPYRYQETLGVLWRESVPSKLGPSEQGLIVGSLAHQDEQGRSLVGALILASGLSIEQWVGRYFDHVVLPLYHLQLQHGLGLVAHGQNVIVQLRDSAPVGMLLKDFQGDLRASTEIPAIAAPEAAQLASALERLPPHHLIHDLITGHFVSVLRFLSATLQESDGLNEKDFYRILAAQVQSYLDDRAPAGVDPGLDLLSESFARVLLNPVRFKIGYADSSARPLPALGTHLPNPLRQGGQGAIVTTA